MNEKTHETIETQLPQGFRLAHADDLDTRDYLVVLEDGIQSVLITGAPDPLVDAMDALFSAPATSWNEQRTPGSLGLVAAQ